MIQKMGRYVLIVMACSLMLAMTVGCGSKEEKAKTAKPVMAPGPAETAAPVAALPAVQSAVPEKKADDAGIAVEVDGVKMTKAQLNTELQNRLAMAKSQIPADSLEQVKAEIRKGLVDDFVLRTLLGREVVVKKVTATEKEIAAIIEEMKSQLPPGVTMDELMKKNQIDTAKMRDEIGMNIKINKLIEQALGGKIKITDKEIADFYEKNKDKFTKPETVHARHILVSRVPEDTEKSLKEKKAKAEDLRKKLLGGADFADLAAKNSDCPSKQAGGDLGTFARGQMVKPFEEAAFSQEKNAIGPVVETDFGFHIIQVLDHQASQVVKLDTDTKQRINAHLNGQKRQVVFDGIVKRLKAAANIVVYGK
ncbi:MAG: peptidylprolyl isomerase [Deltaproteobacteria bacterium]|nr:peptidylprolyl isomerase [Deltaproteobacteria bacterium]